MNNNIGSFLLIFAVGFGLGFLFFRKKEGATKWIAGVAGGIVLPIIVYWSIPCTGSACQPKSFSDMIVNFGFGSTA